MSSSKASFAIRLTLKVEESSWCSMNRSPPALYIKSPEIAEPPARTFAATDMQVVTSSQSLS